MCVITSTPQPQPAPLRQRNMFFMFIAVPWRWAEELVEWCGKKVSLWMTLNLKRQYFRVGIFPTLWYRMVRKEKSWLVLVWPDKRRKEREKKVEWKWWHQIKRRRNKCGVWGAPTVSNTEPNDTKRKCFFPPALPPPTRWIVCKKSIKINYPSCKRCRSVKEAGKVEGKHCEMLRRAYLGLDCASKGSLVREGSRVYWIFKFGRCSL